MKRFIIITVAMALLSVIQIRSAIAEEFKFPSVQGATTGFGSTQNFPATQNIRMVPSEKIDLQGRRVVNVITNVTPSTGASGN